LGSAADWQSLLVNNNQEDGFKYDETRFKELSTSLEANTVVYYGYEASPLSVTLNLIPLLFNSRVNNIIVHVQSQDVADELNKGNGNGNGNKLLQLLTLYGAPSCYKKLIFAPQPNLHLQTDAIIYQHAADHAAALQHPFATSAIAFEKLAKQLSNTFIALFDGVSSASEQEAQLKTAVSHATDFTLRVINGKTSKDMMKMILVSRKSKVESATSQIPTIGVHTFMKGRRLIELFHSMKELDAHTIVMIQNGLLEETNAAAMEIKTKLLPYTHHYRYYTDFPISATWNMIMARHPMDFFLLTHDETVFLKGQIKRVSVWMQQILAQNRQSIVVLRSCHDYKHASLVVSNAAREVIGNFDENLLDHDLVVKDYLIRAQLKNVAVHHLPDIVASLDMQVPEYKFGHVRDVNFHAPLMAKVQKRANDMGYMQQKWGKTLTEYKKPFNNPQNDVDFWEFNMPRLMYSRYGRLTKNFHCNTILYEMGMHLTGAANPLA